MRSERCKDQKELLNSRFGSDFLLAEVIYKNHHLADSGVETKGFDVITDFFYSLMQQSECHLVSIGIFNILSKFSSIFINGHRPSPLKEPEHTFNALHT